MPSGKQRSYAEIAEFFDGNWSHDTNRQVSLERMKALDAALGHPGAKTPAIFICGTNGKSLTTHFAGRLLTEEGLTVATMLSPHILSYQERFTLDSENVANKTFTDIANDIINTASAQGIQATTQELLTMMAFVIAYQAKAHVLIVELDKGAYSHPATFVQPKIVGLTRITAHEVDTEGLALEENLTEYLASATNGTHVVSADQNKTNLLRMSQYAQNAGALWAMPVRKLPALTYPFEQLHGRCAALAERIASIFINDIVDDQYIKADSLLHKTKGQRGRPTLQAKRESELNPKRTLEHFWKEISVNLGGRFQIFEKEKPTILIDNPSNIDAYENFLLGIRLMHYQRTLKGLALVLAFHKDHLDYQEFLRLTRYFFKKTAGHIMVCPVPEQAGVTETSWDAEKVAHDLKNFKVKAKAFRSFKDALEAAKKSVTDRSGLVAIGGPAPVIADYWHLKGLKKI